MAAKAFTDLLIWQRARQWAKAIYSHTQNGDFRADRRLVEQINDSASSVMANIAEGFGRGTQGEFVQFLGYAIGSLNETQSHLTVAYDREYISKELFGQLFAAGTEIRKMTVAFITSMVMGGSGVKNMRKHVPFAHEVWDLYERLTGKPRPAHAPQPAASAR
jgi:four helix bundle protein